MWGAIRRFLGLGGRDEDEQRRQQPQQPQRQAPRQQGSSFLGVNNPNSIQQPGTVITPEKEKPKNQDLLANLQKPKQSLGNRVRDIFDANTEADQYRRMKGNIERGENKEIKLTDPGNIVTQTLPAIPQMINTGINQAREVVETGRGQVAASTGNELALAASLERQDNLRKNYRRNAGGLLGAGTLYNEEEAKRGDLATGAKRIGLGTVEGMMDIAGLGMASVGSKQIAKQGFRQAARNNASLIGKNYALNTVQGGVSSAKEDGSVGDILMSSALSGPLGAGLDLGLASIGSRFLRSPIRKTVANIPGSVPTADVPKTPVSPGVSTSIPDGQVSTSTLQKAAADAGVPMSNPTVSPNGVVEDLSTPSFMSREPRTVGQAQLQADRGVDLPDSLFDADARVDASLTADPLETPSYITRGGDDFIQGRNTRLREIDDELARMSDPSSQTSKWNRTQQLSDLTGTRGRRSADAQREIWERQGDSASFELRRNQLLSERRAVQNELEMAGRARDGSTQTLERPVARIANDVDAQGNPALRTDQQVNQEMVEQGFAPQQTGSQVSADENRMASARGTDTEGMGVLEGGEVQTSQVSGGEQAAPIHREQTSRLIQSEEVMADVQDTFKAKQKVNIEETRNMAEQKVRSMSDDDLAKMYDKEPKIDSPSAYFETVAALERLGKSNKYSEAVVNALDALDAFSSRAGQALRVTQVLYDDMPTAMKVRYLEGKLGKLSDGKIELTPAQRGQLETHIKTSDGFLDSRRALQEKAEDVMRDIELGGGKYTDAEINKLVKDLDEVIDAHEYAQGEAFDYYQTLLPKGSLANRAARVQRTSMLSSLFGRAYDNVVTPITGAFDLADDAVSGAIGKVSNKLTGKKGQLRDTVFDAKGLVRGTKEGISDTYQALGKDKRRVSDFMGELQRNTRGNVTGAKTRVGRGISDLTESATNLSKGQGSQRLRALARQEGRKRGLKGADLKRYVDVREVAPSVKMKAEATQRHLRTNALHDNNVTSTINRMVKAVEDVPVAGPLMKNVVAPFNSWAAGNLHRMLTDRNILWNVGSAVNNIHKRNGQGLVDDLGKLTVNATTATAGGMLLAANGLISDTDANGDSYEAPYLKWGDRYIPMAIFGPAGTNISLGYYMSKLTDSSSEEDFNSAMIDGYGQSLINMANVASNLGGQNPLQRVIAGRGSVSDNLPDLIAAPITQFLPAAGGDINSFLDNYTSLNPTREAAKTRVEGDDGKVNRVQSAINRAKNRIPFVSQGLERDEGKTARDPLDRTIKSNREAPGTAERRESERQSVNEGVKKLQDYNGLTDSIERIISDDNKGAFKKAREGKELSPKELEGIIKDMTKGVTDSGNTRFLEDGDYDSNLAVLKAKRDLKASDPTTTKASLEKYDLQIRRGEVYKKNKYPYELIKQYEDINLTDWRNLGDPSHENYSSDTQKLYQSLFEIDEAMKEANASRGKGDTKINKYYAKKPSSGKGGRGGRGSARLVTDLVKADAGPSVKGLTGRKINPSANSTPIPRIERAGSYNTSNLKKISVRRGVI